MLPEPRSARAATPAPTFPSLAAMSRVASRLNSGAPPEQVLPEILEVFRGQLGAAEFTLWLEDAVGLSPRWRAGSTETQGHEVVSALANGAAQGAGLMVVPLTSGAKRMGALSLRRDSAVLPEEELVLTTLANFLAPFLAADARSRAQSAEIELRTRQIEEQRRLTSHIIDSLPVGLYVIDRNYRIQAWNKKRETGMQGVSRAAAMGRTIFEVLHRQAESELRREFDEVFETGVVQQFHTESSTPSARVFRVSKIPMRLDGGEVTHVITIGEDITEWKEATDRMSQADKLAAVGQLAAGVMHEINNPLATISACAESLSLLVEDMRALGYAMNKQFAEYLTIIDSEVQRCKRIVDSLLEFSHPRSLSKEPVSVDDVIEQTLFLVKHHSKFKRVGVARELHAGARGKVQANRDQMVQVFMALLINASDAMGESGRLVVRSRVSSDPAPQVVVDVVDEGHGIARSDVPKIFEPFYTTKGAGRGTGLGLSICYAIITEHGGRIEVDSVPGKGSAFKVILPLAQ